MKKLIVAVAACAALAAGAKEALVYVGAHPDETECGAGTLLLLKDRFDIHVVDVTRGERGLGEAGYRDGSTVKTRFAEEQKACAMLGAQAHYLDEIDGDAYASKRAAGKLAELLRTVKPRVIFSQWPADNHPDHVQAFALTRRAIAEAGWKGELYLYEANPGTQTVNFHPNAYVDITSVLEKKQDFIRCYACQNENDGLAQATARKAAYRGRQCRPCVRYAEAFATWTGAPAAEGTLLRELACWNVPPRDEVYQLTVGADGLPELKERPSDRWNARARTCPREKVVWFNVWMDDADKTDLPQVLLVGDSIAFGNHYPLRDALKGKAYESLLSGSACVGDPILMKQLEPVLTTWAFDVIVVNNGLHNLKDYTPEDYGANLRDYLERIRELQPQAKVVWMRTTPLRDPKDLSKPASDNRIVLARNAVADKVVASLGIPSADLYVVAEGHPEYYKTDGTHFVEAGKKPLCDAIVSAVLPLLP